MPTCSAAADERNPASPINPLASRTTLPGSGTDPDYSFSGASITLREGTAYVWDVEPLSPRAEGTMTIRAQRHPGLTTPATITNTVEFDMDEYGPFNDCTLMVVGGLRTAIPLALSGYQQ